jgi:hypothetical protein
MTGVTGVTFSVYKEQQGGTPLWSEIQNVPLDEGGRYGVLLGATQGSGLPIELFTSNEPRWLGVQAQVGGEEEQPRVLLVSVPYALKAADADTIGGRPASAFVLADLGGDGTKPSSGTTNALSANDAPVGGTGSTDKLPKWLDSGTLADSSVSDINGSVSIGTNAFFASSGKVGIGTISPISKLDVVVEGHSDYITLSAYGANLIDKGFLVRTARGTSAAPTPVANGDILFNLYAQGQNGPDFGISGGVTMVVDGPVAGGIVPGAVLFRTTNLAGNFDERMRINAAGNAGIGTTNPTARLEVDGGIRLNTTTARPACDATTRGTFWFTQGAAGIKDSAEVCAKDASNAYAWRTLY